MRARARALREAGGNIDPRQEVPAGDREWSGLWSDHDLPVDATAGTEAGAVILCGRVVVGSRFGKHCQRGGRNRLTR